MVETTFRFPKKHWFQVVSHLFFFVSSCHLFLVVSLNKYLKVLLVKKCLKVGKMMSKARHGLRAEHPFEYQNQTSVLYF